MYDSLARLENGKCYKSVGLGLNSGGVSPSFGPDLNIKFSPEGQYLPVRGLVYGRYLVACDAPWSRLQGALVNHCSSRCNLGHIMATVVQSTQALLGKKKRFITESILAC